MSSTYIPNRSSHTHTQKQGHVDCEFVTVCEPSAPSLNHWRRFPLCQCGRMFKFPAAYSHKVIQWHPTGGIIDAREQAQDSDALNLAFVCDALALPMPAQPEWHWHCQCHWPGPSPPPAGTAIQVDTLSSSSTVTIVARSLRLRLNLNVQVQVERCLYAWLHDASATPPSSLSSSSV